MTTTSTTAAAAEEESYDAALAALMSPAHQASDKESLRKSAARRVLTVADMRTYWGRIQWTKGGAPAAPKRMIHITGTKGKGSTASLCQAILKSHGYSTGLFTSPHLIDIRERIRLDGRPVHPNIFAKAYWKIRKDLEAHHSDDADDDDLPPLPGYFRMLTLMAFYIFTELRPTVDVWIIEVGMGGRHDATNFLDRDTILERPTICGVTLLDLDHTRVLGNTLEQIAWEKGGIFAVHKGSTSNLTPKPSELSSTEAEGATTLETKEEDEEQEPPSAPEDPSSTFFILDSNTEGVLRVFRQCAKNEGRGGVLQTVDSKGVELRTALGENPLGLAGQHQYGNATLALHLCHAATATKEHDSGLFSPSFEVFQNDSKTLQGLIQARWPARCQTVQPHGPSFTFRLDGAHTPQSLTATMEWFSSLIHANPRRVLIFNCSHERDPIELLELLKHGGFTAVYFAKSDSSRPSPVKKASARELLEGANIKVRDDWIASIRTDKTAETWQETLGIIWKHVTADVVPPPTVSASTNGRHMKHYSVPLICNKSASEIIRELSASILEPTEVLVTGSLYIVGSFLTALEWSEDSSPDYSAALGE